jgi:hypothetical protein
VLHHPIPLKGQGQGHGFQLTANSQLFFSNQTSLTMFIRVLSLFLSVITMIWAAKQTATTTTTITPNSKAVVEMSGSNYFVGLQTGTIIYWSTTLNSTFSTGYVLADTGNAVVTFKKGITVTIQDNAGKYSHD